MIPVYRWLAALGLAAVVGTAGAPAAERPNIVLIFSDDHAWQAISAYGEERHLLDTPNIDRLAQEGVRFDRCLVPNSICGPSRATVLTGKYSHMNGFYNNTNSRFDSSQQTFVKLLQQAGYQTAIFGKWHLVSNPTGFDYWHILPGQGVYYNPPMILNGKQAKHEGYTTDLISDFSIDWLKQRDKSKPFLLMSQHKAPHREWDPALRHLGHDNDRKYPEPPTLFDDYANRGLAIRDQDMTLEKTFNAAGRQVDAAEEFDAGAAESVERLLRTAERGISQGEAARQGPGPLAVQPLHARLSGLHQGRGRGGRQAPEVSR